MCIQNRSPASFYFTEEMNRVIAIPSEEKMGYTDYRIPGMVVSKRGTLILYWEYRNRFVNHDYKGNHDQGLSSLYIRRSCDGGEHFDEPILIADGSLYRANGFGETINNPVMFVDDYNTLHMIFSCNVGMKGIWYTKSVDDGVTWTIPQDISDSLNQIEWSQLACGPTHGIFTHNGRLITTVWINIGKYEVATLYSDNHGQTWNLGEIVSQNHDESCLAELSNGNIIINSRQYTYPYRDHHCSRPADTSYRVTSVSTNGISGWSESKFDYHLPDPACEGSMCSVVFQRKHLVLFCNCASKIKRRQLTLRYSTDNCSTWESVDLGRYLDDVGGYSDISVDIDGKVYLCLEEPGKEGYMQIRLLRLNMSDSAQL